MKRTETTETIKHGNIQYVSRTTDEDQPTNK